MDGVCTKHSQADFKISKLHFYKLFIMVDAFIDKGYAKPVDFCFQFLYSHEFEISTLKKIAPSAGATHLNEARVIKDFG